MESNEIIAVAEIPATVKQEMIALYLEVQCATVDKYFFPMSHDDLSRFIHDLLDAGIGVAFLYYQRKVLVAFCVATPARDNLLKVSSFTVSSKAKGFGRKLMLLVQQYAHDEGKTFFAWTPKAFNGARGFYATMKVIETTDRSTFPEAPPAWGNPEDWVCLWYPKLDSRPDAPAGCLVIILYQEGVLGADQDVEFVARCFKNTSAIIKRVNVQSTTLDRVISFVQAKKASRVFVYYVGHGRRNLDTLDDDKFPVIDFGNNTSVKQSEILDKLRALNLELTIVGSDCCNATPLIGAVSRAQRQALPFTENPFGGTGWLIFGASSPEEPSWGASDGGYFTSALFSVFQGSWKPALERARQLAADRCKRSFLPVQTAQWQEELKEAGHAAPEVVQRAGSAFDEFEDA